MYQSMYCRMDYSTTQNSSMNIQKELREMMFGFGDDRNSSLESVKLLEVMVLDHIHEVKDISSSFCFFFSSPFRSFLFVSFIEV